MIQRIVNIPAVLAVLVAGSLAGCASQKKAVTAEPAAPVAQVPPATPPPTDLRARMAREATDLDGRDVTSPDGRLQLHVPAKGEVTVTALEGQSGWEISIPIGGEQPVSCVVSPERPDPASKVSAVLQAVFEKFPDREIAGVDSGEASGAPWIGTEVAYIVMDGGHRRGGYFKLVQGVLADGSGGVFCLHDEPGFARTFRTVATEVLASAKLQGAAQPVPAFHTIDLASMGGQRVGFIETRFAQDDTGGWNAFHFASLLVPSSKTDLTAVDSADFEGMDPAGRILRAYHVRGQDGRVVRALNLALELEGDAKDKKKKAKPKAKGKADLPSYTVTGELDGKPFEARITAEAPLLGLTGRAALVARELLSGSAAEVSFPEYLPSVNPKAATRVVVRKVEGGFELVEGEERSRVSFDDKGYSNGQRATLPGGAEFRSERVFTEGEAPAQVQ